MFNTTVPPTLSCSSARRSRRTREMECPADTKRCQLPALSSRVHTMGCSRHSSSERNRHAWLSSYISAVLNITAAPFQLADFIQVREQICEWGHDHLSNIYVYIYNVLQSWIVHCILNNSKMNKISTLRQCLTLKEEHGLLKMVPRRESFLKRNFEWLTLSNLLNCYLYKV